MNCVNGPGRHSHSVTETNLADHLDDERGDPPLSLLCLHQVPQYKCPECGIEANENTSKASALIKSILAKAAKSLGVNADPDAPRVEGE